METFKILCYVNFTGDSYVYKTAKKIIDHEYP